eukprot:784984-Prymnesium_polylepis.1
MRCAPCAAEKRMRATAEAEATAQPLLRLSSCRLAEGHRAWSGSGTGASESVSPASVSGGTGAGASAAAGAGAGLGAGTGVSAAVIVCRCRCRCRGHCRLPRDAFPVQNTVDCLDFVYFLRNVLLGTS